MPWAPLAGGIAGPRRAVFAGATAAEAIPAPGDGAGAPGAGLSRGRSVAGTALAAPGDATGPAATAGGALGLGCTTALRAVALISAIDRVRGWSSDAKSCNFLMSSPPATGASATGAGGTGETGAGGEASACSGAAPPSARKCVRTFSATSSSSALEWDFLS